MFRIKYNTLTIMRLYINIFMYHLVLYMIICHSYICHYYNNSNNLLDLYLLCCIYSKSENHYQNLYFILLIICILILTTYSLTQIFHSNLLKK
jgi:hypothetical protein